MIIINQIVLIDTTIYDRTQLTDGRIIRIYQPSSSAPPLVHCALSPTEALRRVPFQHIIIIFFRQRHMCWEGWREGGYRLPIPTRDGRIQKQSRQERTGKEKWEGPFEINSIQRFMLALGQFTHWHTGRTDQGGGRISMETHGGVYHIGDRKIARNRKGSE